MSTFAIVKVSPSGRVGQMQFPFEHWLEINLWMTAPPGHRPHIQRALPFLDAEHREFLISGTTPEEWREIFGEDDE
ncbi:hypothetical protein [Nocardia jiangxiensis]|uniref:hypothetical protein n=1 Tax=Nocardia jiangxiensis TaxID=282685 RepID=UPI0012F6D5C1|nr:hypothetical protein [Nocardia jiangxiensis]